MSDTTGPTSTPDRSTVVLDDGPATPQLGGPTTAAPTGSGAAGAPASPSTPGQGAPASTSTAAAPAPVQKSDAQLRAEAEALVLDLGKRQRGVAEREKGLLKREERVKTFESLGALAERDPVGFVDQIAKAARLDRDRVVELLTLQRAGGGGVALSAEERVARLEADRERERAEAATRDADAARARDEQDADAAVARHVNDLKGLATAKAAEFPLVSRRLETGAVAAFDLMVLHHQAGQPINHEAALRLVEDQLRADAEADAQVLGFQKSASAQPTSHVTPPGASPPSGAVNGAPSAVSAAGAAPFESAFTVKSDEDIAREWARMFRAS